MSRASRPARNVARAALLALATAFATSFATGCQPVAPDANAARDTPPDLWITIGSARVAAELADTPEKQSRGLGYRDDLAWGDGMYFRYQRAGFYAFWMKGMRFSIDIVWIRNGRIVDIDHEVPFEPGGNGPTLRPDELTDAVLEVPAGYAAAQGWGRGDRVRLERPDG